ncbi:hypothetical protein CP967_05945 [Streptomyces nitrosporeus]|uniref:LPXTG cell wall anchor domain-containing protein n=1 Tax=Streptomyces nitrosporeus TaxID=28894 RepID=A0A5J6F6D2_9ACTN|nr:hypothetical protein [Streptomyces nitrosporeus]QEU71566.1 hypothetical protein CP967_05945 [Streptomyces nitrosporeus]GGZ11423.1 hypothetical protein GCM10010327_47740 [Streptomyces nitrosporeus]
MRMSASPRSRTVRAGTALAAAVAAAGVTLAAAPAAHALPGDNGDLDVRAAGWASEGKTAGVEVCKFVLVAKNFETLPAVPWTITEQPPTVPPGDTLLGTLPLVDGRGTSQEYLLPEGTYQLVWTVTSGPRQKSFEVDCTKPQNAGDSRQGGDGNRDGSQSGSGKGYEKPSGAVPAGGGGVPDMESVSSESDSGLGTTAALAAGAAGIAGLVLVRRTALRRARNQA